MRKGTLDDVEWLLYCTDYSICQCSAALTASRVQAVVVCISVQCSLPAPCAADRALDCVVGHT